MRARADELSIALRQADDGHWRAWVDGQVVARSTSAEACRKQAVRQLSPTERTIVVELWPRLVGVAEAAEILGWDKRRVVTYVDRGAFPAPLQALAGGRVWALDDVRAFARVFRARQRTRRRRAEGWP